MEMLNRQQQYDPLDTEAKRLVRQKIDGILTPELRRECPGLAIMVLSVAEYQIIRVALRESGRRKKLMATNNSRDITLNIVRDQNDHYNTVK